MKLTRPAALAAASLLLLSTSTALATPPPDLGGTSWRASMDVDPSYGTPGAPGDVVTTVERSCDAFGNATISMVATGTAEGPYPGTFQEEISLIMGPVVRPTFDDRDVESATGTFSIDSSLGQVEGSLLFDRALTHVPGDPSQSGATGWCLDEPLPGFEFVTPQTSAGGAITSYHATITTPDGCSYVDEGGDVDTTDDSVFAGGFDLRSAPHPQGSTVAMNFQSDGAALDVGPCDSPTTFEGFFAPVNNLPVLNEVKAGRAIPVKFGLGGDQALDVFASGYPRSEEVDCSQIASSIVDGIEETTSAGSSSLTYDAASDRYTYVWKMADEWSGSCRQLVMKLQDGSVHRANFRFR